jgi:hypothetical protein
MLRAILPPPMKAMVAGAESGERLAAGEFMSDSACGAGREHTILMPRR